MEGQNIISKFNNGSTTQNWELYYQEANGFTIKNSDQSKFLSKTDATSVTIDESANSYWKIEEQSGAYIIRDPESSNVLTIENNKDGKNIILAP